MQSSAFYLWLITGILGYATKIPLVRNVIGLLSLWYGRTTWWSLLVKLRKAFVTFNAIIGMYMVYKTTGFGYENILAGFAGMGHTYVEIFMNLNKKVFNWLYNLIDHKIVPDVPSNPPTNWFNGTNNIPTPTRKGVEWFSGPYADNKLEKLYDENAFSLRKLYTENPVNININTTPWYKDITSWLLLGGGLACVGVLYLGIKVFMDPLLINDMPLIGNWFKPGDINVTPTQENVGGPEFVQGSSKSTLSTIGTALLGGLKKLNPATWFMTSVDHEGAKEAFNVAQSKLGFNNDYYPFKPIHPHDSWLKRLRISWLGETTFERSTRHALRNATWAEVMPPLQVGTPLLSSVSSSLTATPTMSSIGLNLNLTNIGETAFMNTASKFSSVSNTPTNLPMPLPLPEITNAFAVTLGDALERLKGHVSPVAEASGSNVTLDSLAPKITVTAPVSVPVESTPLTLPVDMPPVVKATSVVSKTVAELDES